MADVDSMRIELVRIYTCPTYTIGKLYVDGEYVCDVIEDTDRGLYQGMPLSELKRKKVKSLTAIPTGTYPLTMSVQSPKFAQYEYYKKYCKGYLPRLLQVDGFDGVLIHCLTPDMEILTEHGWKNYEQFKENPEQNCFSYNTDTCEVELTPITNFIEQDYEGIIYSCTGRVNYSVTDKHRMWVNVVKHGEYREWQWRTADDLPRNSKFVTAAIKNEGWELTPHQKLLYRLIIATQADGYILNWSQTASQVKFHFKKERKIQRIKDILDEIGDNYNVFVDKSGCTHISLSPKLSEYLTEVMNPNRNVYCTKELPWELLKLNASDMRDLVMDYLFWDGRWENYLKNNKSMIISTTKERTLDILQAMAFMSGFRTTQYKAVRENKKHADCLELKLYENQETTIPDSPSYKTKEYDGKVWCISNKNHTIIVRQNGHASVIGNCGSSAASSAGCLICGFNRVKGMVVDSRKAWEKLMKQYLMPAKVLGKKITIKITTKYKTK